MDRDFIFDNFLIIHEMVESLIRRGMSEKEAFARVHFLWAEASDSELCEELYPAISSLRRIPWFDQEYQRCGYEFQELFSLQGLD